MNELLAWAAGLFEGEGAVLVDGRGNITLQLCMTDRDVVDRFCSVVGGLVSSKPLTPSPEWQSRLPQWRWRVHQRRHVYRIMAHFWPYLGERRRARFLAGIDAKEQWRRERGRWSPLDDLSFAIVQSELASVR